MDEVNNSADVIDSRDVIERIGELEVDEQLADWEQDELTALRDLNEQAPSADWVHGATLIRDSYFEDYARQLAEDIGAIDKDTGWPATHIDWEAAADALRQDYTSVEFDGVTYWVR